MTKSILMTQAFMMIYIMTTIPYSLSTQTLIVPDQLSATPIVDIAANYSSTANAHANILVAHLITQLPVKSAASNHSPS
jgi:hypothetical protein